MDLSDSLGLPLYFEASPSTYKLYEKMGYETLDDKIVHSAELMGTDAPVEVPLMVKMPRAAGGLTFKEWRAAGYPAAFGKSKDAAAAAVVQTLPRRGADKVVGQVVVVTEAREAAA